MFIGTHCIFNLEWTETFFKYTAHFSWFGWFKNIYYFFLMIMKTKHVKNTGQIFRWGQIGKLPRGVKGGKLPGGGAKRAKNCTGIEKYLSQTCFLRLPVMKAQQSSLVGVQEVSISIYRFPPVDRSSLEGIYFYRREEITTRGSNFSTRGMHKKITLLEACWKQLYMLITPPKGCWKLLRKLLLPSM